MTMKNRIVCALLGALAFAIATLLLPWLPDALVGILGTGGVLLFLAALVLPTNTRQPPVHSLAILDKGYLTPAEIHQILGIWLPSGSSALDARDAQWTVARHVAKWRADHVVNVMDFHGVVAERRIDMLSVVQWVGIQLLPAFLGLIFLIPTLALSGFDKISINFLQTLLLFVVWGGVALLARWILEKHVIHRFVWEPELTPDGTRFVEKA
ncbi:hypothetical protein [Promicromonospora sukumoe]